MSSALEEVVLRLADRRPGRTEANVQSDLHTLLTQAPLNLEEVDLQDVVLESPAGQRRRIDVEVGQTVFEVKRDLRSGKVRQEAVEQLAGYVRDRTASSGQRYVGVLTDGAEWHLYHLADDALVHVAALVTDPRGPDIDALFVWLETVLATAEMLQPSPQEIVRRLGSESPAHKLDRLELTLLYQANRANPTVRLKRQLWAKLLTTALGTNFEDADSLFVEHTLLVNTAEIIAHAVVGIDPNDPTVSPLSLLEGALFEHSQVGGVVEADFFDWVAEVPGGDRFVRTLARRLTRFDWSDVQHDVMKVLYESIINAQTRHDLGEYYTPDWLAETIIRSVVSDPVNQKVLDPACGSGTFLFHAVRLHIQEAERQGQGLEELMRGVTSNVIGIDVHPVAVTFARVTYLLALGMKRLQSPERPPITIPVYLGDSVQWGQERTLLQSDALLVPTDDGAQLFANELRFPERLLLDASAFDRLVSELANKAASRSPGAAVPSLSSTFRRFAVHPDDQPVLTDTFRVMCELHDQGRDHIWGYYVRNLARPIWLSLPNNRVDVLVGNPPWLSYRYMPAAMQANFRQMSAERGMWGGASLATNVDLSALFLVRCIELYLRDGGRFGFVMPLATLSRQQYAGLRSGKFDTSGHSLALAFDVPWDLHQVKPSFFPVPASVVLGSRAETPGPLTQAPTQWSGRLPMSNMTLDEALPHLLQHQGTGRTDAKESSPYRQRFSQGATLVPRVLLIVEEQPLSALGSGAGRRPVRSRRSTLEKPPWKDLPALSGTVEEQFIRPVHLGDTLLPHRCLEPWLTVLPWDGKRLLTGDDGRIDLYPGLADWWRKAEAAWMANRSSPRLTLKERIDFRRGLSQQLPASAHRVVYTKGGMYLAAARVSDSRVVIDHKLYWCTAASLEEARYLSAILNSDALTLLVRPLQARGEHNPRDFDKYVFDIPIPLFDASDPAHVALVELAARAEATAAQVSVEDPVSFQVHRRRIRLALADAGIASATDDAVLSIVAPS